MYSCAYVWTWVSDSGCTWCECCSSFFLVACSTCACTWKAAFRCSCQVKCPVSAYSANRAHCKVQVDMNTSFCSHLLEWAWNAALQCIKMHTALMCWHSCTHVLAKQLVTPLVGYLDWCIRVAGSFKCCSQTYFWQVTSCWMLSSKQPYQYMTWLLWSTYTEGKTACLLQSCAAWKYHPKKTCCTHV